MRYRAAAPAIGAESRIAYAAAAPLAGRAGPLAWRAVLTLLSQLSGIFDSDSKRNPFAGAHLVYMPYCSSDAWVGDAGPESNDWGFYFKGQRILEAALKQLQQGVAVTTINVEHFLNHTHATSTTTTTYALTAADKVLFGGCSAGGRGAMFNLDFVQSMLPAGAPPVLGFFDSALWVDMLPLVPSSEISLENETQQIFALVNATARLGDACAAAYPGAEGWRCLYGQYRLPYVQTPYLLSASQFDKFQLPYNEGSNPPYAPGPNLTYALTFQAAVRTVMLNLPTAAQPRSAVYSSACYKHCTSTLAYGAFWGVKVGDVSLKEYLAAWCVQGSTPKPLALLLPLTCRPAPRRSGISGAPTGRSGTVQTRARQHCLPACRRSASTRARTAMRAASAIARWRRRSRRCRRHTRSHCWPARHRSSTPPRRSPRRATSARRLRRRPS